jgi:hypothetical protein
MRVSLVMGVSMVEAIDVGSGTAAFHECDDVGCDGQGGIAGCKDNRTDEWIGIGEVWHFRLLQRKGSRRFAQIRPTQIDAEFLVFCI